MFNNYLLSGCIIGCAIFTFGLWFGVLRGYDIYRHKRSLLLLITLSTIFPPILTYWLLIANDPVTQAEPLALYGAIAGFLISTLAAEYLMRGTRSARVQPPPPMRVQPPPPMRVQPPLPIRVPIAAPERSMEMRPPSKEIVAFHRRLRYTVYFFIFLFIFLFPPYYESWTQNRAWVFIGSSNVRPFFVFDFAFLLYELILLATVSSGIEFWLAKSQNGEDTKANSNQFPRNSHP